jgi:cysteine-rich repeat protein
LANRKPRSLGRGPKLARCAFVVLGIVGAAAGAARASDADLVRCAVKLDQVVYKLARASEQTARDCLKDAAEGPAPPSFSLADCVAADTAGRIAHASARLVTVDAVSCAARPTFGAALVEVAQAMTPSETTALLGDLFGADASGAFYLDAIDAPGRRCAWAAAKLASRLRLAGLRDYFAAKARALLANAFADPQALIDGLAGAERRDRLLERAGPKLAGSCAAGKRASILPGACAAAADAAACIAEHAHCRTCRLATASDQVAGDCDAIDNGSLDASCAAAFESACGNGSLDAGEQCDDADPAGADCCSSACEVIAAGAPCADDGDACTTDVCNGAGTCAHASNCAWSFTDATALAGISAAHAYDEVALVNPELEYAIIAAESRRATSTATD